MWKHLLLVGLGGGLGSMLRYLTTLFAGRWGLWALPWGTFAVNIVGCLLIGLLVGLAERYQLFAGPLRFLLITGFCGGYTTFSAFSAENLALLESGEYTAFFLYVALSVALGIAAVFTGLLFSRVAF